MHELRHKASVEVDVGDLPLVTADESRLAQLLVNLLVNAGQAFTTSDPASNRVRVVGEVRGDTVVLSVIDNGPGISPEIQTRIFDPFFTTKPVGQGTGLGLAICHSIVVSLGGKIECISSPGDGTRFEVTLRAAPQATEAQLELLADERLGRVMVVDDDEAVLRAISRALGKLHHTRVFADAREAKKALEAGERFDVIFCDLAMPHISGAELSRLIDTLDPEQGRRLVFITGGVLDSATAAFLQQSPLEQLEKPVSTQALRTVARRYINRANRVPTRV
jgi:CheY-like chemotaxis protein